MSGLLNVHKSGSLSNYSAKRLQKQMRMQIMPIAGNPPKHTQNKASAGTKSDQNCKRDIHVKARHGYSLACGFLSMKQRQYLSLLSPMATPVSSRLPGFPHARRSALLSPCGSFALTFGLHLLAGAAHKSKDGISLLISGKFTSESGIERGLLT